MAKNDNLKDFLTDLADAIREKKGTSDPINPQDFSTEIASIETGGGGGDESEERHIVFYDHLGEKIKEYSSEEFLALSEMPAIRQIDDLVGSWSHSYSFVKTMAESGAWVDIGAIYSAPDGSNRFKINFINEDLLDITINFKQTVSHGVQIDWGDGSGVESLDNTGNVQIKHNYTTKGPYIIKIKTSDNEPFTISSSYGAFMSFVGNIDYAIFSDDIYEGENRYVFSGVPKIDYLAIHGVVNSYSLNVATVSPNITGIYAYSKLYTFNYGSLYNIRLVISNCEGTNPISTECSRLILHENCKWHRSLPGKTQKNLTLPNNMNIEGSMLKNIEFLSVYNDFSINNDDASNSSVKYVFGPNANEDNSALIKNGQPYYITKRVKTLVLQTATYSIKGVSYSDIERVIIEGGSTMGASFFYAKLLKEVVFPSSLMALSGNFTGCKSLILDTIPNGIVTLPYNCFRECTAMSIFHVPPSVQNINNGVFAYCSGLKKILFVQHTSIPSLSSADAFIKISNDCEIVVPQSLYSNWKSATNWSSIAEHIHSDYTPTECTSLYITSQDVGGRSTVANINWFATTNGLDYNSNVLENIEVTGTDISEPFPQNTSYTDTVERTISYTYMGVTATTTITQGVWVDSGYTLNLNDGQWGLSETIPNPDTTLYDGVYQSVKSKGIDNGYDTMYIDILGYETFKLYIRSYAESNYDYVMVSQLDKTINGSTSYSDTTLVKAHTRGNQQSGTAIGNYTLVEFTGIDSGEHRITVVYRKDGSSASGDDRGYVLIPKVQ